MSILVVGSIALDAIETPFGSVREALGGAATYFATVASLYDRVNLVGVVGTDFPPEHLEFLRGLNVDLRGLQVADGRTFRWAGRYDLDINTRETLATELNVFADFHPQLPAGYESSECVFLANIDPDLQLDVLNQVSGRPKLIALDTMNFWISSKRDSLTAAIRRVDVVLMNESEIRQYTDTYNLTRAARQILALGPRALIVKKGEYGAGLFCRDCDPAGGYFFAPAYPLESLADPTGAGDTFAGGLVGYLARAGEVTDEAIRQAIVHGSVVASFTVEDFSVNRLRKLTLDDIHKRYETFRRFTAF